MYAYINNYSKINTLKYYIRVNAYNWWEAPPSSHLTASSLNCSSQSPVARKGARIYLVAVWAICRNASAFAALVSARFDWSVVLRSPSKHLRDNACLYFDCSRAIGLRLFSCRRGGCYIVDVIWDTSFWCHVTAGDSALQSCHSFATVESCKDWSVQQSIKP